MGKKYDIVLKAGEYQKDGQTKSKWMNLGAVMENDKGPYLILDPHVNLAAFMEDGRDMIIASLFEPKQQGQQQGQHQPHKQNNQHSSGGSNFTDFDNDVGF